MMVSEVVNNNKVEDHSFGVIPLTSNQRDKLKQVIEKFPDSAIMGLGKTSILHHQIDMGDALPQQQRFYPISPAVEKQMYAELDRMIELNVIQESDSDWRSPMALVRKQNGKVRLSLDARKPNEVT